MSEDLKDAEAIAESVRRGDDAFVVPEELVEEAEKGVPVRKGLYAQILEMKVGERIKLALKGNRDARMILIRDSNRLIQRFVLQNPRLTDEEVVAIARNRHLESELLKEIGEHKYWPRNYQVRLALVTNPKTPIVTALHFVNSLQERDLRQLAKSKNVPGAVVSVARRILIQRGK
jgi:hypothetical protein